MKKAFKMRPELTILSDGTKEWILDGWLHREDGPAYICSDDYMEWHIEGRLHRTDGPAIVFPDASKQWWLNGGPYRQKEWLKKIIEHSLKRYNNIPN